VAQCHVFSLLAATYIYFFFGLVYVVALIDRCFTFFTDSCLCYYFGFTFSVSKLLCSEY